MREVAFFYMRRRDAFEALARQALPSDLAEWSSPSAGMFVWLQLRGTAHKGAMRPEAMTLTGHPFPLARRFRHTAAHPRQGRQGEGAAVARTGV